MFTFQRVEGSKQEVYEHLLKQAQGLFADETDWVANLANAASLLYHALDRLNWAGFYLYREGELVLGPFMGKPACIRIPAGKGVCGTAFAEKQTQRVPDVLKFPGHIACDAATRSEIVIPLFHEGNVVGVLDIDSPEPERFDEEDQTYLEQFAAVLQDNIDWSKMS
ncbi:protein YtsP [Marinithermofilum abyssi]|uniref:Protein YtsP n=1 Tax=Marinithermofilum abyssi TaxID=1571185 RepID=A0A8J2YDS2_9BACL|nr:GAF domain-containing protein [Marinithermofilum abyssi]GGE19592.1 protein YtsP [Marinithermofilum abyssi]